MTALLDPPITAPVEPQLTPASASAPAARPVAGLTGGRRALLFGAWFAALMLGMALVVYGLGPFSQHREQRGLMRQIRADINRSANEASGLAGITVATKAVETGSPIAILEIGALRMRQAVVEGTGASQTRNAPGHVAGTAGPGQPGNSVMVGRRAAFGGPFQRVRELRKGDDILVTTVQGQTVYEVTSVRKVALGHDVDKVYGPSKADQLTLVTSASLSPLNRSSATVAVAQLKGPPFAPTPQGARRDSDIGTKGDRGALASVILALVVYGLAMGAGIVIYRRLRSRTAYILTIAPVVALTIIAAETFSRLFPAWM